ncbi:telomerase reverse transcriptase isoform X4 [Typha angustifolia]|uniref:telomerase reverse transcriptase isoform X4 n=1 Tax=Typha angustifolia TaxID=59011 RepID=UPI003C2DA39A
MARSKRRRRRNRVPELFRRAYDDRAHSLKEAILSLLPSPPPPSSEECTCGGRRCLGCADASSYLLRARDSAAYRHLLSRAICVVSRAAPSPPVFFLGNNFTQRQIVRSTIELIMDSSDRIDNVLCNSYNKLFSPCPHQQVHFSPLGEFVCSCTWDLLLTRIGDPLMIFLLRYSSIFLPVKNRGYHQVAGPRLNTLLQSSDFLRTSLTSRNQERMEIIPNACSLGHKFKRNHASFGERQDVDATLLPSCPLSVDKYIPCQSYQTSYNPSKHLLVCQRTSQQIDLQVLLRDHRTDSFCYEPNCSVKPPEQVGKSICFQSEEQRSWHKSDVISQTSILKKKEFLHSVNDCKVESGKALITESEASSHAEDMHLEQVTTSSEDRCGSLGLLITDVSHLSSISFHSKSKKRKRLFSWQRHKKRKLNYSRETIFTETEPTVSDVNASHHSLETYDLKHQRVIGISECIVSEDAVVSNNGNCHSVHAIDMYQGGTMLSSEKSIHQLSSADVAEVSEGKNYNIMDSLGIQSTFSEETLTPEILCFKKMLTEEHKDELLFENIGSSKNSNNLQIHFQKNSPHCFHCLTMRASRKVSTDAQIKRQYIFYNKSSSFSIFPRNHILNRLKPNDSGAHSLMKHIFGFPDSCLNFLPCICYGGSTTYKSDCLYHILLCLLKSVIRNARRCQYRKLLLKHCNVTDLKQFKEDDSDSIYEAVNGKVQMGKDMNNEQQYASSGIFAGCPKTLTMPSKRPHLITSQDFDPSFEPSKSFCKNQHVVSFIWAASRSIIPVSLLGSSCSWRSLRKNIWKFVQLRRFENFHLKECIHGLKVSSYPFLAKVGLYDCCCNNGTRYETDNGKRLRDTKISCNIKAMIRENLFHCWMYWFFSFMVVPMISANFYVTERESKRHDLFYYAKPVWKKLLSRAIACLKEQHYRLLDHAFLRDVFCQRAFGFSKVRFLPKEKNVRPLANLKAPSRLQLPCHEISCSAMKEGEERMHTKVMSSVRKRKFFYYRSVNSSLRELHVILRKIKFDHPQLLGSTVFDYNDVYKKMHQFLSKVKTRAKMMPQVFIVVADVSKAFDSIDQDMLMKIMEDVIENGEYVVRKYRQIVCTKKSMGAIHDLPSYGCISDGNSSSSKPELAIQLTSSSGIFVDQADIQKITKEKLHHLLFEHVKRNVLKLDQKFYVQKVGISQGSLLSCLLCSFYYGHMERHVILPYLEKSYKQPNGNSEKHKVINTSCKCGSKGCSVEQDICSLSGVETIGNCVQKLARAIKLDKNHAANEYDNENSPDNLLVRLIDDFLFITTSKKQATSFLNRMRRGFRDYNCFMNNSKYGVNFDLQKNKPFLNRVYTGDDGKSFLPWSGLLLNCRTLEIQADYTRYCDITIRSTITVQTHARPAYYLRRKLCDYMRPKCHPLLYDSNINSPAIVGLNAYQAFLLCAMKFHCYVCSMPGTKLNSSYLLKIIERTFSYMHNLINKLMHDMEIHSNIRPVLQLKRKEIIWLGLSAYIRVLRKKQSRHKELLSFLKSRIAIYGPMECASCHLRYAVDDSHSSIFWRFKF